MPRVSLAVLVYLLIAAALGALIVSMTLLFQRQSDQAKQTAQVLAEVRQQNETIKDLLQRQNQNDAQRQQLIDDAVAQIAAEQYRALVAHDRRTEDLLRRNGRLLEREVNNPANMENQPVTVIPMPQRMAVPAPRVGPAVPQTSPAPKPTPQTAPAPQPAPSPKPSACQPRGKSGKCKR